MEITKIFIIAIVCCISAITVSQFKPEYAVFIQLCSVAAVAALVSDSAVEIISMTKDLTAGTQINGEYILLLFKTVIIAVAGKVVSDICSDNGNRAIAVCVDIGCRISILLLSFPMIKVLLQLTSDMIKE